MPQQPRKQSLASYSGCVPPIRVRKVNLRHTYGFRSGIEKLLKEKILLQESNNDNENENDNENNNNNNSMKNASSSSSSSFPPELFVNGVDLISETRDPVIVVAISTSPTLLPLSAVPFDVKSGKRQVVNFGSNNNNNSTNDDVFDIFRENKNNNSQVQHDDVGKKNNSSNNILHFYKQFAAVIEISCHIKDPARYESFPSIEHQPDRAPIGLRFSLNSLTFFDENESTEADGEKLDEDSGKNSSLHHAKSSSSLSLQPSLFSSKSLFKNTLSKISGDSKDEAIRNNYLRLFSCGVCIVQMKIHHRPSLQQQQQDASSSPSFSTATPSFSSSSIRDGTLIAHCIPAIHCVTIAAASGFSAGDARNSDSRLRASFTRFQPGDYPVSVSAIPSCEAFPSLSSTSSFHQQNNNNNNNRFVAASAFIAVGTSRSGVFIFSLQAFGDEVLVNSNDSTTSSSSSSVVNSSLQMCPIRVLSSCDPPSSSPFFSIQFATSASHLSTVPPFSQSSNLDLLKSRVGSLIVGSRLAYPLSWKATTSLNNEHSAAGVVASSSSSSGASSLLQHQVAPASLPPSPMLTIFASSWRSLAGSRVWNIGGQLPISNIHGAAAASAHRLYGGASCAGFGVLIVEKEKWGFLNAQSVVEKVVVVDPVMMEGSDDDDHHHEDEKAKRLAEKKNQKENGNQDDDGHDDDEEKEEMNSDTRYGRFSLAATAPLVFTDATFGHHVNSNNNNSNSIYNHLLGTWIVTEHERGRAAFSVGLAVKICGVQFKSRAPSTINLYSEAKCYHVEQNNQQQNLLPLRRERLINDEGEQETHDDESNNDKKNITNHSNKSAGKKSSKQQQESSSSSSVVGANDNPLHALCAPKNNMTEASHILKIRVSQALKVSSPNKIHHENTSNNKKNDDESNNKKSLNFFTKISLVRYDGANPSNLDSLRIFSMEALGVFDRDTKKKNKRAPTEKSNNSEGRIVRRGRPRKHPVDGGGGAPGKDAAKKNKTTSTTKTKKKTKKGRGGDDDDDESTSSEEFEDDSSQNTSDDEYTGSDEEEDDDDTTTSSSSSSSSDDDDSSESESDDTPKRKPAKEVTTVKKVPGKKK